MELDKKDLENLIIESLMVRVKKKQEVEEGIVGGIKGIAGGVKSLYKMGSLKSDIESTLKKINSDKQNLEKLKQRADELGLQTSDAALYKKLTDAISAISDTPASAPAPAAGPGGASTGTAAGATPSVGGLASSNPSSVATRAASSGVSGGGSTSFTTTTVGGPSGGTAATRVTRTRGAGAAAAPTSSPTSVAASAPDTAKGSETTAPETSPAGEPAPEAASPAAATATAAGKKSIKPQNKQALIAAVKDTYLKFDPKDDAVKKAIEGIYNDFTAEIKNFAVKSGKITEEDKKEIKLSEIIKKYTASLDTDQKKEVNKFVNILSQLTINFGYGNVFAEDFGVGVIVDAEPPEEELEVDADELEAGEDESSTPTDTSTTAASTDASTDTSTADASTDTGQGPSIGEPDDLDFLHDPSDPQYIEFSNSLKKAGITDELVIKYVSRFMFPDQDDQYEITENKIKYIKEIILEEAKRTIDLTRFLKSRGYEDKVIKQVLLALQNFSKKVVLAAKAKEIAEKEFPDTTSTEAPAANAPELQKSNVVSPDGKEDEISADNEPDDNLPGMKKIAISYDKTQAERIKKFVEEIKYAKAETLRMMEPGDVLIVTETEGRTATENEELAQKMGIKMFDKTEQARLYVKNQRPVGGDEIIKIFQSISDTKPTEPAVEPQAAGQAAEPAGSAAEPQAAGPAAEPAKADNTQLDNLKRSYAANLKASEEQIKNNKIISLMVAEPSLEKAKEIIGQFFKEPIEIEANKEVYFTEEEFNENYEGFNELNKSIAWIIDLRKKVENTKKALEEMEKNGQPYPYVNVLTPSRASVPAKPVAAEPAKTEPAAGPAAEPAKAEKGETKQEAEIKARGKLDKLQLLPKDKKTIGIKLTAAKTAEEVNKIISDAENQAKAQPSAAVAAPSTAATQESEIDKAKRIAIDLANKLYSKTDLPDIIDGIKASETLEEIETMFEPSNKGNSKKSFKQSMKTGTAEVVTNAAGKKQPPKESDEEREAREAAQEKAEAEEEQNKRLAQLAGIKSGEIKEPEDLENAPAKPAAEPAKTEPAAGPAAEPAKAEPAAEPTPKRRRSSRKSQKESLQYEPMFILKEGVFVLNKKVL